MRTYITAIKSHYGTNEDPFTSFSKIANKMMSNSEKIFGRDADVITFGHTQYYSQTMYDRLKEENARLRAENDLLMEKYCKSNEFMC